MGNAQVRIATTGSAVLLSCPRTSAVRKASIALAKQMLPLLLTQTLQTRAHAAQLSPLAWQPANRVLPGQRWPHYSPWLRAGAAGRPGSCWARRSCTRQPSALPPLQWQSAAARHQTGAPRCGPAPGGSSTITPAAAFRYTASMQRCVCGCLVKNSSLTTRTTACCDRNAVVHVQLTHRAQPAAVPRVCTSLHKLAAAQTLSAHRVEASM
jgi:hypothetical protein